MIFYDYGIPWHFDLSGAMSQLIRSFTQVVPPVWIMKRWRSLVKKGDGTWIHHNSSYSYLDIFSSIFAFFGEAFNNIQHKGRGASEKTKYRSCCTNRSFSWWAGWWNNNEADSPDMFSAFEKMCSNTSRVWTLHCSVRPKVWTPHIWSYLLVSAFIVPANLRQRSTDVHTPEWIDYVLFLLPPLGSGQSRLFAQNLTVSYSTTSNSMWLR